MLAYHGWNSTRKVYHTLGRENLTNVAACRAAHSARSAASSICGYVNEVTPVAHNNHVLSQLMCSRKTRLRVIAPLPHDKRRLLLAAHLKQSAQQGSCSFGQSFATQNGAASFVSQPLRVAGKQAASGWCAAWEAAALEGMENV
jgi:hypothetical protein